MSHLNAIVYVSAAVQPVRRDDLSALLQRSRARNLAEQVTGLLVYCDGNFIQYLEGPPAPLARVYASIQQDALHHGLIELFNDPVATREFEGWSMAYTPMQIRDFDELARASWRDDGASPHGVSAGRRLLRQVWLRLRDAGH